MRKLRNWLIATACAAPLLAWGYGEYVRRAEAQCPGVNCTAATVVNMPIDGPRATYGAGIRALVAPSSPTDIVQVCGSASKTVRITKVIFSGRASTAVSLDVTLVRRSTANTGQTTNITPVTYDTNNAASSLTPFAYTTNPVTLGTSLGSIASRQYFLANLTTTIGTPPLEWHFGNRPAQALVLRGATQCLSVSLDQGGTSYSGNSLDVAFEWTEAD